MLTLDQVRSPDTWRRFAPGFHIGDNAYLKSVTALDLGANRREELMGQLRFDGYFHESGIDLGIDHAAVATTVRALSAAGILPVFAFVFDEFWMPFHKLHPWYAGLLGDYAMLPAFWVWNLEPSKGDAGWAPHRDKGHMALLPDGSPRALTTWIPLSPSLPLNGCMYIVPASADPAYGTPNDNQIRFELPAIRALPAQPGDVLMWNQAVLHWGGRTSPRAPHSRVSMAFEFQQTGTAPYYEPPLKPRAFIPFDQRLTLIANQILRYRHMYKFDPATVAIAEKLAVA
ncbi:MAG: phytanoyl-CoA dioxygenase family protein [Alphaproteobacteria bacterium]|nr:phytanoyl-CoA dioxygenase family protein [Alphaproteobacteria bacterium]